MKNLFFLSIAYLLLGMPAYAQDIVTKKMSAYPPKIGTPLGVDYALFNDSGITKRININQICAVCNSTSSVDSSISWNLHGNSGTLSNTNFIGTKDAQDLVFKINGALSGLLDSAKSNTYFGWNAGQYGNTPFASGNLFLGAMAGQYNRSSGSVLIGDRANRYGTLAGANVVIGQIAMLMDTSGYQNVVIGTSALGSSPTSANTVAIGYSALANNIADGNIGIGSQVLQNNTTGVNIAIGYQSMFNSVAGFENIAIGNSSLGHCEGNGNIAMGAGTFNNNLDGVGNIILGAEVMGSVPGGSYNVAIGLENGYASYGYGNIYIGRGATSADSALFCAAIGYLALAHSREIAISDSFFYLHLHLNGMQAGYVLTGIDSLGNALWRAPVYHIDSLYFPSDSAETNINSITWDTLQYSVTGNTVTVWGSVDIAASVPAMLTYLEITLPVESGITRSGLIAGTCSDGVHTMQVIGNTDTNKAAIQYTALDTNLRTVTLQFSYKIQ